jgi:hypothetical protein
MATLQDLVGEDLAAYEIEYRTHATRRMFQWGLFNDDVERVLFQGEIIEEYDETRPFHHVLLSGRVRFRLPLHVAAIIDTSEKRVTIITAYEPDSLKWKDDFTRRR